VTGQDSTNLVFTILGFHTIIVIGFHHHCWWSSYQDPHLHLREFFDLYKLQHIQGLDPEGIKLVLFPFSLKDNANAKLWYNSLPAVSIHTSEELSSRFLKKFFLAQNTRKLRRGIQSFQQRDGDLFFEAWGHFNELLLSVHITTYLNMSSNQPFMKI
jgi:hypothetical protein